MTDPKEQQPLTMNDLLSVLQKFRNEDRVERRKAREEERAQRKEEIEQIATKVSQSQEQFQTELRNELREEIQRITDDVNALKSHVTFMGATTFLNRVSEETASDGPEKQPDKSVAATSLPSPPRNLMPQPKAQSTPPARTSTPAPALKRDASTDVFSGESLYLPVARPAIIPTEYDGKTPWGRYALQFEAVSRANGWNDCLGATYLATFLRGTALAFYETMDQETRGSYSKLCEAFQVRFGTDHQRTIAHIQLRSRLQRNGESFAEFATDVQRLTHLTFSDCPEGAKDRIALEQFLDGIADLDIQERVRDSAPHTLQEALQSAIRVEASHRATKAARRNIRVAAVQGSAPGRRRNFIRPNESQEGIREATPSTSRAGNDRELA